jgi:hypothetical protein
MSRYLQIAAWAASVAILSSAPAMAADTPDATITFTGGAVAFIGGVSWGGGTLHYKGKDYPLQVGGLSLGEVGIKKFDAKGEVYHLTKVSDIEGTYAAGSGNITVGAGVGGTQMQNSAGVVIHTGQTSAGASLKFGPTGVSIKLKK